MKSNEVISTIGSISDEYIVIGVSAGPDSMALLHMIMHNTQKKIVCAHINHKLRKESDEEEAYIEKYCIDNNIIFEKKSITKYTQTNLENEARIKRYAFYKQILKKYHSHYLLLAHHGDDLIETVLMKIVRGSNLEGYAGIKTISKLQDFTIIRPLLSLTKEDIMEYNKKHNIKFFIDKTNSDQNYTRNRYRINILPLLKIEDKNVHQKFLKYSNTLQEYYNYIEDVATEKINNIYEDNTIDINVFNKEHPFMQKNIIFHILSNIYNDKDNIIKDKHIEAIIKLAKNNKPNLSINLPQNYIAEKKYNLISIKKDISSTKTYKYQIKNINKIDDYIIKKVKFCNYDGNNVCRLNSKNIKLPLFLRNRKDGDIIEVLGLNGHKKVKEIFIEKKIPAKDRDNYPLLVDSNDNILWIPNLKKSKYNVKKDELCDIILTSYREGEDNNNEKES